MIHLSPKERFQKTPNAKAHQDLVLKDHFQEALTSALAEFSMRSGGYQSPSQAWDNHCKLSGAREFISILLNLAEPESQPSRLPSKDFMPETMPALKKNEPKPKE